MIKFLRALIKKFRPNRLPIHRHGYWEGSKQEEVRLCAPFDQPLAHCLVSFFQREGAKSVVDFGCGMGDYIKTLLQHQISCEGYDGNPYTHQLTEGLGKIADLSQRVELNKKFDWVLSLEVGEHIPKKHMRTFLENLHRHAMKGIVLSWAVKGQGGHGHFNEQNNDSIKHLMAEYGYTSDLMEETSMRAHSTLEWFKNTIMVFRKNIYAEVKLFPEDLQGWFFNKAPLRKIIKHRKVKVVVEVGSWKGQSTCQIAKMLPKDGKVYAIDSWVGFPQKYYTDYNTETLYQQFLSNVIHQKLTDKIVPVRMESQKAAETLAIVPDLIYLDANHEFDAIYADLTSWYPFVKGHGILCGDDWDWTWPELPGFPVKEAVTQFANEHHLRIETDGWFWQLNQL